MFDGLIGVKDSGESLDLFFDGQDEPFTIAKHGNDSLVAQLMPYVVPDSAQKLNEGGNDAYDPKRAARQAAIETKKAEIAAQQAALDEQQAGLDAIAADEEYADVPTEGESEAMAAGEQERALAEESAAREQASAAARAEGSAEAEAAWAARQAADARLPPPAPAQSSVSLGSGPAPLVESDEAREARLIREANAANPTWRNSPAVGAPTYAVTTFGEPVASDAGIESDVRGPSALQQIRSGLAAFGERFLNQSDAAEALAVQEAARPPRPADESTALSPEEQAMARRSAGGREAGKFEAFKTQAAGAPPQGGGTGGSVAQRLAMSSRGGGKGVDTNVRPMPARDDSLVDEQVKTALFMGDLKAEAELAKAKVLENAEIERAAVDSQWKDRLAQNDRAIQELDSDIRNGKVDPNRLWANMDGARQATTMIGLVLGGLAQGGSGFRTENMALQTLNRMIDRDIDAQKDTLGRKESLLQMHMQQGRDLRSAWQMTKADMQVSLAAQLAAQAARSGSQQQQTAAQAAALNLRQQAQAAQAAAEGAWRDDEHKRIDVQSLAAQRMAEAQKVRIETALKVAEANRAPGGGEPGKNPPMEIAPGVIVQPADATSRQNLEKAVDAFNTMRNLIVEARAHRAKAGAQLIPRTADYVKADRLEKQLITALNNVENLGAFDKGTADLLGKIVPTIGGVYTTGVVDSSLADLLNLATKKFQTKVMTNVVPGTGLVNFTGAQSDFKPVGKAD